MIASIPRCQTDVTAMLRYRVSAAETFQFKEKFTMLVAHVTEISASSSKSIEAAIENGIEWANDTLDNDQGAWAQDIEVICKDGKTDDYRVIMKVTFVRR